MVSPVSGEAEGEAMNIDDIRKRLEAAKLPLGRVEPLDPVKYYGTHVRFDRAGTLEVWFGCADGDDEAPSEREIAVRGDRYLADNHYEDVHDYAVADFFANAPADMRILLDMLDACSKRVSALEAQVRNNT